MKWLLDNIKDGITKVINDPEGAFNAVSVKLSEQLV